MYRNCPEHPEIKEMLKNGEVIRSIPRRFSADEDCQTSEEGQVYYLSEQNFAEICLKRKHNNGCR